MLKHFYQRDRFEVSNEVAGSFDILRLSREASISPYGCNEPKTTIRAGKPL